MKPILFLCLLISFFATCPQYARDPAWSSDGKEIVYVAMVNDYSQVFIMDVDGSNRRQVTNQPFNHYYPFFSPDNQAIVFMSNRKATTICKVKRDGNDYTCLTNEKVENADPHWSPDGRKIIYYSAQYGNNEICIMNADGSQQERLTNHAASDQTPSISPDGTKIVFVSNRTGNAELFQMNIDGSGIRQLTFDPRSDRVPSWSPDGRRVLWYAREISKVAGSNSNSWKTAEIYTMTTDNLQRKMLTLNLDMDHGPVYSPDGEWIAFTSGRTGNREIFLMDKNGEKVKQLTFSK